MSIDPLEVARDLLRVIDERIGDMSAEMRADILDVLTVEIARRYEAIAEAEADRGVVDDDDEDDDAGDEP